MLGVLLLVWPMLGAARDYIRLQVSDPYIELRTGPGRGYPITFIAERGEAIQILKRRTDWFKVRTERQREGWVSRAQMESTLAAEGVSDAIRDEVLEDFLEDRVEAGFAVGQFDGDPVVAFRAAYKFNENFLAEIAYHQVSGTFSSSQLLSANLMLQPYVRNRYVPYFTIGVGGFENTDRATLVGEDETITSTIANAGAGVRVYLTRNFVVRADYREYLSLTEIPENDDFSEWVIGLSFFF